MPLCQIIIAITCSAYRHGGGGKRPTDQVVYGAMTLDAAGASGATLCKADHDDQTG